MGSPFPAPPPVMIPKEIMEVVEAILLDKERIHLDLKLSVDEAYEVIALLKRLRAK